jgi:hypothetical protein
MKNKDGKKEIPKKMGTPTKYRKNYARMAYVLCAESGLTDKKLAMVFDVCEKTINNWKLKHSDFLQSIQKGKDEFNCGKAEGSLFKLAMGFYHTVTTKEARPIVFKNRDGTEKIIGDKLLVTKKVRKFIPPNDRALRFFLKNRDPARWRDTQAVEVTGNDGGPIKQQLTKFPCGPLTLAEWERQVLELNEQNAKLKNDNFNSGD